MLVFNSSYSDRVAYGSYLESLLLSSFRLRWRPQKRSRGTDNPEISLEEGCDEQSFPPPANPTMEELAQGHLPATTRIGAPRDEQAISCHKFEMVEGYQRRNNSILRIILNTVFFFHFF